MNLFQLACHTGLKSFESPQKPISESELEANSFDHYLSQMFLKSIGISNENLKPLGVVTSHDELLAIYGDLFNIQRYNRNFGPLTKEELPSEITEFYIDKIQWSDEVINSERGNAKLISFNEKGNRIAFALVFETESRNGIQATKAIRLLPINKNSIYPWDANHLRWDHLLGEDSKITLPVFPSVFHTSNVFVNFLLEVILPPLRKRYLKNPEMKLLVMGTGAGPEVAILSGKHGYKVDAVDINPIAIANTLVTCSYLGIKNSLVQTWVSDGFNSVKDRYDVIILNAPLGNEEFDKQDFDRADINVYDQEGQFLRKLLSELPHYLKPEGVLYLMNHPNIKNLLPPKPNKLKHKRLALWPNIFNQFAIHEICLPKPFFKF